LIFVGLSLFFIIVLTLVEQLAPKERYSLRSRMSGIVLNIAGAVLGGLISYELVLFWHAFVSGPFITVPLSESFRPLGSLAAVAAAACLIALVDFLHYWRHRLEHWVFWGIHKVHHAPTELHAANSIGHPLQVIPEFLVVTVPLTLFAFEGPAVPLSVAMVIFFWARFVHSPVEFHLGPLRRLVVDNRFHRIHHSIEPHHKGKNYGIFFTIWDQLFGTAYFPGKDEWPPTGVLGLKPPRSVREYLLMPVR
jgi:sterol desaturase/sphingolipid hydroxylase (fatty acid hydroxylase superfamily)